MGRPKMQSQIIRNINFRNARTPHRKDVPMRAF
jgi:hypothetical protein